MSYLILCQGSQVNQGNQGMVAEEVMVVAFLDYQVVKVVMADILIIPLCQGSQVNHGDVKIVYIGIA
jgi:hypothetical protein